MVEVQKETTKEPITLIGKEAGICWGSVIWDKEKNYKRGIECIKANHGRALEFPQVYLVIDGYSARCIRELYTHIGGLPTRLQESTRYIDCSNFSYITPPSIESNTQASLEYDLLMTNISGCYERFLEYGIPKEDIANILPLGMTSKIVLRTNLRQLIDIMKVRQCTRAYWEIRNLMKEIKLELSNYSEEWKELCDKYMPIKCDELDFCNETHSCGRKEKKK